MIFHFNRFYEITTFFIVDKHVDFSLVSLTCRFFLLANFHFKLLKSHSMAGISIVFGWKMKKKMENWRIELEIHLKYFGLHNNGYILVHALMNFKYYWNISCCAVAFFSSSILVKSFLQHIFIIWAGKKNNLNTEFGIQL